MLVHLLYLYIICENNSAVFHVNKKARQVPYQTLLFFSRLPLQHFYAGNSKGALPDICLLLSDYVLRVVDIRVSPVF